MDFKIFSNLPCELRELIWKWACHLNPQTIGIFINPVLRITDYLDHPVKPVIFNVDREARRIAKKVFAPVGCRNGFYTNVECDTYHLFFDFKCEFEWPTFRYVGQDREGEQLKRINGVYIPRSQFPELPIVPRLFDTIRHLQIYLTLKPYSCALEDKEAFRAWADDAVSLFLEKFAANTVKHFPKLKSFHFVVDRNKDPYWDPNAHLELRNIEDVIIKEGLDEKSFSDGVLGSSGLLVIEDALRIQFRNLYKGEGTPDWIVGMKLLIPEIAPVRMREESFDTDREMESLGHGKEDGIDSDEIHMFAIYADELDWDEHDVGVAQG